MERIILHCDLNNFYASVEVLKKPEYRDVPLIVCGSSDARHGVVLAKNELAKKAGIKTGDVIWQAKQKCAGLVSVPPDFALYQKYSKKAFNIYSRYTCYVEPFGSDECWLDISGSLKIFGDGKTIADTLRQVVKKELGLTISAGVSFTKTFAKLASDMKKPDATTVISRENFKETVWDLPVGELFMVGKKSAEKLSRYKIKTIGALANTDDAFLKTLLGINGIKSKQNALGLDDEPVREYVESFKNKSIGHGMTATRDIISYPEAEALISYLADLVAVRMRKAKVWGSGVAVDLRDYTLHSVIKQHKLDAPVRNATAITDTAAKLARQIWDGKLPLRTITVSVYGLINEGEAMQASFFDTAAAKNDNLDLALDKIRAKHGANIIKRASLVERDFIYDKNEDEDFLPFKR